ncbi:UvrD-helicase domain-containing protein [Fusibacter paucivorans]|uniref:DNA 3'-5' helicase n=1 Tax=Fusibacter paucivorans TaxID=76009 RepID=A0ABS5PPD8_9FIRM|nr:UvrD-helicase domain-containing protein [Fusibacter paucivorans]MBS7527033.1 UvrD-helicase domain-containing protein [Fusibacter paucivorans]
MTKWTIEQQAAIELRGCELLVSAAAGSGKTAVLVERITRMVIDDHIPIDEMLIVTYTNAAAGEMRARIETALSNAMQTSNGDKSFLQEQLKRLNRAHIKTFHAFCLDVVRQHFQKLEIDPAFRMANESELQVLVFQALEETLELFYEAETPAFIQLVESYSGNRDDVKLRELILSLYRFIQSQAYPIKWLAEQVEQYASSGEKICTKWFSDMETYHKWMLQSGIELLVYAIRICDDTPGLEGYRETLTMDLQAFERMCALEGDAFQAAITQFEFSRLKPLKKEMKAQIDPAVIDEVKGEIRDKVIKKQIFEKIKQFYNYKTAARYQAEIVDQGPLFGTMLEIIRTFTVRFDTLKRKRNVLDFGDLEHFAVQLLDDDSIASRYREHFQFIFVDEYQDASGIQEQIIKSIKRKNALFMVGDLKQSIYKFRLADPQIFVSKYNRFHKLSAFGIDSVSAIADLNQSFAETAAHTEHLVRVDLKQNFRTRDVILDSVNVIFSAVMQPPLGEIAYDDDAKLYPGMTFEPAMDSKVEVNLISKALLENEERDLSTALASNDASDGSQETLESYFEDMKNDEIEARAAVLKIKTILGTPIYHPKQKITAPCTYKDIVLLIRSVRSWTPIFETVFMEEGLPLFADNPTGYFDTLEIKFILSLLKVIADPYDDIALLTVLRSPIVGLGISELIGVKKAADRAHYLYDGVQAGHDADTETGKKLKGFTERLETWRQASTYMMLDEFLWMLLRDSGLYHYCIAMPGGSARAANLTLLIDRASELRQSQIISLNQFIQFIEALHNASGDMGVAKTIGENDNVIRLMSIHKSKGLEFPVVLLLGLGRRINLMDSYGDLLMHKDEGIALAYVDLDKRTRSKSLPQWVIKNRIQWETYAEELRVLYVALTRPVDRLILFGTYAALPKKMRVWRRGASRQLFWNPQGLMDWIMPNWLDLPQVKVNCLDAAHFEMEAVDQHRDWMQRLLQWRESRRETSPDDVMVQAQFPDRTEAIKSEQGTEGEIVEKILSYQYPKVLDGLPAKTSVTSMQTAYKPPTLSEVPTFSDTSQISGAERGTLTHAFLERLDFHKIQTPETLKEQLHQYTSSGIFTEDEADVIDLQKISVFLASPLGMKLRAIEKHHHEIPFIHRIETQMVQGIIDFYAELPSELLLVDFKTDYRVPDSDDLMWQKYRQQIDYYRIALEALTGKKVTAAYLVFLMAGEVIAVSRSENSENI